MTDKILIAESEPTVATFLKKIVEYDKANNLEADIALDGKSFMSFIKKEEYAMILIDMAFGNINVIDFISKYSSAKPLVPIITTSANIDINVALTALRTGAYDFVSKPFTADTMLLVIKNAHEKRQLLQDKEQLNMDIQMVNDELTNANEIITHQKEQINVSLTNVLSEIERIKELSTTLSSIKSTDTTINLIHDKVQELYSPNAAEILIFDEKKKVYIVKKEYNPDKEFTAGTVINENQFKHIVSNNAISIEKSIKHAEESNTVYLPLSMGKLNVGIMILDLKSKYCSEYARHFMDMLQHLVTISITNSKFLEESRRSYLESLIAFLLLEEKIHKGIKHHSEIVSSISIKIGRIVKLSEDDMRTLQYASLLHLLGLTSIPAEMFTYENYLSEEKGPIIKNAIVGGADILTPIAYLESTQKVIRMIYENFDGSGIPTGAAGDNIPYASRIIRVAGEYLAMSNRFKMGRTDIEKRMNDGKGTLYDPKIVDLMYEVIKKS